MANAFDLIQKCIEQQNTYLDLGCCGLTDAEIGEGSVLDLALRACTHIETLILSNIWWSWKHIFKGENLLRVFAPCIYSFTNFLTTFLSPACAERK